MLRALHHPQCGPVLPVLGPSTARDTFASLANFVGGDAWYNVTVNNDTQYFSDVDWQIMEPRPRQPR